MNNAASMDERKMLQHGLAKPSREPADLKALLLAMRGRYSTNPIDKVCAIAFPFLKRGSHNFRNVTFPIYDPSTPISAAWGRLISSITSTKMEVDDLPEDVYNEGRRVKHTPTIQLLRLFPHPSKHHWFPSWTQVQQYPNVSVRDNDPVLVTEGMDYSLRIMSGRIYRGCSLELHRPPTPKRKAIYGCSMDGNRVKLVATVPGIGLNIDLRRKYVLVDISPDRSLWPSELDGRCMETGIGHDHPPIWLESVIIVCEEVDRLAQPVRYTEGESIITRYYLRRVTTLEWDCGELTKISARKWSYRPRHWLPFKPSLVHMRSVVCSAEGGPHSVSSLPSPDVFCDPVVYEGWREESRDGELHDEADKRCPMYEVYLV